MNKKFRTLVGLFFIGFALLLVGCSGGSTNDSQAALSATEGTALAESGTLYLKVNPEIAINYDENGKVTSIFGENDDGNEIVALYPDFIGKDSGLVVKELIALIGEAGYFVEEIEGEAKKIVIELEEGSAMPGNNFLEVMAASAQTAVEEYKLNSKLEVAGEEYITVEDAKKIAFDHAGVDGTNAKFDDQELDVDDGEPHFELEFKIDNVEYEYDIHAVTGEIIKFENDRDEDTSNDDSSYEDSAYGEPVKPAAEKPATKPAPKPAAKKPAAEKSATKPAPKPVAPKPAPKPAAPKNDTDYSDYDDTDYDDSGYDDSDYDDTDDDDSDYDDSDYDDSDYDDSDYD